jgi:hypothetical protein
MPLGWQWWSIIGLASYVYLDTLQTEVMLQRPWQVAQLFSSLASLGLTSSLEIDTSAKLRVAAEHELLKRIILRHSEATLPAVGKEFT